MKRSIGILVTSAGTASAVNVIRALRQQDEFDVHIGAVDADPTAAGLRLADVAEIAPRVDSLDYIPFLMAMGRRHGLEVILPIYSSEILVIAREARRFHEEGMATLLSPPEVIELCDNKEMAARQAREVGIRVPRTYEAEEWSLLRPGDFPLFIKPNKGSSSWGAQRVDSQAELKYLASRQANLILQEFVEGPEATVDVLCDHQSRPIVISPRSRLEVKGGQSTKCCTLPLDQFAGAVERLIKAFGMRGVCNIQFITQGSNLVFIEINPRFAAGGLMVTVAAGANIPKLMLKLILNLPIKKQERVVRPGVHMSRYWNEVVWYS